ncbi:MAG: hypothetical protein NTY15_07100 [Planctomycetota bacterium]|nr:hypothetical protein [Planctomycetota bacterium]
MPNYTLVLITDSLLARVDVCVRAKVSIESVGTVAIPENASLATLVESVLATGPKGISPVWLFSNRFWTGPISIPSDLHEMANGDELNQAALLEAETQSGIPAFQSKVAMTRIKKDPHGDPQYWVTQALETELEEIEQAFCVSKTKWAGIAHVANHCPANPSENTNAIEQSLDSEWDIRNWAVEAVKDLSAKIPTRPYFAPPVKVLSPRTQTLLASVVASLIVLVCAIVYHRDRNALQHIEQLSSNASKQNDSVEALSRQLQKAESSLDENRKKLQDEQTRFEKLKKDFELSRFNQSLISGHCANLIEAIANSADADSWLQSIESNAAKTTLKGLSLNEASAHRFASGLEQQPKLIGHTVSPAQITPLENDLIQFSIVIDLATATESPHQSKESLP